MIYHVIQREVENAEESEEKDNPINIIIIRISKRKGKFNLYNIIVYRVMFNENHDDDLKKVNRSY